MKPEFMRLRRALSGVFVAVLLAAGIVAVSPAMSASAHNKNVSHSCNDGLSVTLTHYPKNTTVKVVIDGVVKTDGGAGSETFSPTWIEQYSWTNAADHTFTVSVISPDDPTGSKGWTFSMTKAVTGCQPADAPQLAITSHTCVSPSADNGTLDFSLRGVTSGKIYTVDLYEGATKKATTTSTGGNGSFTGLAAGNYKVAASVAGGSVAWSAVVAVIRCAVSAPNITLTVQPCTVGGALGAMSASLTKLTIGEAYTVKLHAAGGAVLETLPLTATAASFSAAFAGQGSGTYYVTVSAGGAILSTSASGTIKQCSSRLAVIVTVEPCVTTAAGIDREITVAVEGMAASTVYTVELVDTDPAAAVPVIDTVTTPGTSATTFAHTFANVPSPGEYIVRVSAGTDSLTSDAVDALDCDLPTLAPPTIEAVVDQCDTTSTGPGALSAVLGDLDATKTYFVRIVDKAGNTVAGGSDALVSGVTSATVAFPNITAPGDYAAQLLVNPGKQLAATGTNSVTLNVCLPTLAITGPGVLFPLGSVAALLLTLGGAVVMGRLRRRMAL